MNKSDMRLFIELLKERCAARQREILLLKQLNERLKEAQSCSLIENTGLRSQNEKLRQIIVAQEHKRDTRFNLLNRAFWEVAAGFECELKDWQKAATRIIYYGFKTMEDTRNATQQ
jgi:hypothetical protein